MDNRQYFVNFLNKIEHWGLKDWTLAPNGNEPYAYSPSDESRVNLEIPMELLNTWTADPRKALNTAAAGPRVINLLAIHFLQYGPP